MTPPRRTPQGLETSNSRGGGLRYHSHCDFSCELEKEELPFDCSFFTATLLDDMERQTQWYLELHYPEFTFEIVKSKTKPKGDYVVSIGGGRHRVANWRKA